jgi:hypothetical protein
VHAPRSEGERMELYIIEGVSMAYVIMWLLGLPISLIVLLWLVGVGR